MCIGGLRTLPIWYIPAECGCTSWNSRTFPLYYFYLLVAVRFDIAFNKHLVCVWNGCHVWRDYVNNVIKLVNIRNFDTWSVMYWCKSWPSLAVCTPKYSRNQFAPSPTLFTVPNVHRWAVYQSWYCSKASLSAGIYVPTRGFIHVVLK